MPFRKIFFDLREPKGGMKCHMYKIDCLYERLVFLHIQQMKDKGQSFCKMNEREDLMSREVRRSESAGEAERP